MNILMLRVELGDLLCEYYKYTFKIHPNLTYLIFFISTKLYVPSASLAQRVCNSICSKPCQCHFFQHLKSDILQHNCQGCEYYMK